VGAIRVLEHDERELELTTLDLLALFSRKAYDLFPHVFTSYEGNGKSVDEAVA
jgi:hypothetical protein